MNFCVIPGRQDVAQEDDRYFPGAVCQAPCDKRHPVYLIGSLVEWVGAGRGSNPAAFYLHGFGQSGMLCGLVKIELLLPTS